MAAERRTVKAWLRGLREAQGWSQADVGEMLGVSRETIGGLESAKKGFSNGFTLIRYLRLLGVLSNEAPVEIPGLGRLAALEEEVAQLPKAADLDRAVETLRAAIDSLASPDDDAGRPATTGQPH